LLILILTILIQISLLPKITVKAQENDTVIIEPGNVGITLKKGEYYIIKANITNNGTEAIQLN